jgi:hypothetical protein
VKPIVKYIEHKPAEHTDRADGWIAHVWPSASGKTLYFNGMALKRGTGGDSNHFDIVTGESYWITGVKKRGSNRHWSVNTPVMIEQTLVQWYQDYTQGKGHRNLVVIADIPQPDIKSFELIQNTKSLDNESGF